MEHLLQAADFCSRRSDSHSGVKNSVCCDITPYTPVEVYWRFGITYCLHLRNLRVSQASNQQTVRRAACFFLVTCLAYSFTLKMEALCSETSVNYQSTQRHIPVDSILQKISCVCRESLPQKPIIESEVGNCIPAMVARICATLFVSVTSAGCGMRVSLGVSSCSELGSDISTSIVVALDSRSTWRQTSKRDGISIWNLSIPLMLKQPYVTKG